MAFPGFSDLFPINSAVPHGTREDDMSEKGVADPDFEIPDREASADADDACREDGTVHADFEEFNEDPSPQNSSLRIGTYIFAAVVLLLITIISMYGL